MNIVQNDYGYDINFAVTDSDSNIVDLSGGSVWFMVASPITYTNLISGACIIDTAASGLCHYTTIGSSFPTVGTYVWQLSTVWSGLKVQTFDGTETINVVKKL